MAERVYTNDEPATATCGVGHQFTVVGGQTGDEYSCQVGNCDAIAVI